MWVLHPDMERKATPLSSFITLLWGSSDQAQGSSRTFLEGRIPRKCPILTYTHSWGSSSQPTGTCQPGNEDLLDMRSVIRVDMAAWPHLFTQIYITVWGKIDDPSCKDKAWRLNDRNTCGLPRSDLWRFCISCPPKTGQRAIQTQNLQDYKMLIGWARGLHRTGESTGFSCLHSSP